MNRFTLRWIMFACPDPWYVGHVTRPIFEATFSADPALALPFETREAAEAVAALWGRARGRRPKKPRGPFFEIVEVP